MSNVTFEDFCHNLSSVVADGFRRYVEQRTGTLDPRPDIEWEELFCDFAEYLFDPEGGRNG